MTIRVTEGPKRVLVTDADLALGKALAIALGKDGWSVAVHYEQSESEAKTVADSIRAAGGQAESIQARLTDEEQTATLERAAQEALGGPLTLLINSAVYGVKDTALEHTSESWDHHFNENLRAPVLLSQHFARALGLNDAGLIVNFIDMPALKPDRDYFSYTLANAARASATLSLARALAPNIRVNGIGLAPGSMRESNYDAVIQTLRYLIEADSVTGQILANDSPGFVLNASRDAAS